MNCIKCSMVCRIVFCTEFSDIPENRGEEEDGENWQMQNALLFKQTQKGKKGFNHVYAYFILARINKSFNCRKKFGRLCEKLMQKSCAANH